MTDDQSLDQLLADTFGMPEDVLERLLSERTLGRAAMLLHQRGQVHAAALLLDAQLLSWEGQHSEDYDWMLGTGSSWDVALIDVEPYLLPRFTDERVEEIRTALHSTEEREGRLVRSVRMRESLPVVSGNWREQLASELGTSSPDNQARRVRLEPDHPREDNLHFTNVWERKVYVVLRAKQASLPPNDTLGIFPLPGGRVDSNSTIEPDFLVTYRGRAGVIEVDGPHHASPHRRASDLSREKRLRSAGIAHVDRIDVRDTTTKPEVEALVDTFLLRLEERR